MNSESPRDEAKQAEEKVLGAIKSGGVAMRPRWHFVIRAVLLVTGIIMVILALLYLASFIIFMLRENGAWFAPLFGVAGWAALFSSLPWILILLLGFFIILLAVLMHQYAFAYQRPLTYLVVGIVAIVMIGGFIIAGTSFHRTLFDSARRGRLPVLGAFYRGFGPQRPGDIHRGTVLATTTDGFVMADAGGGTSMVVSLGIPIVGSDVVVFGERTPSGTIAAMGVRAVAAGN